MKTKTRLSQNGLKWTEYVLEKHSAIIIKKFHLNYVTNFLYVSVISDIKGGTAPRGLIFKDFVHFLKK